MYATQALYFDRINVAWSPVPGATSYRVYRSMHPKDPNPVLLTKRPIKDCSYTDWDLDLRPLTPYFYLVEAISSLNSKIVSRKAFNTEPGSLFWSYGKNCELAQGMIQRITSGMIAFGPKEETPPPFFPPMNSKIKLSSITPTVSLHYDDVTSVMKHEMNPAVKVVARKLMARSYPLNRWESA